MSQTTVRLFAFTLAALLAAPAATWSASGGVAYLPMGNKRKSKVEMIVDTRWVDSNGYRPIRVTVKSWPPGPAPADRQFRITLGTNHYGGSSGVSVTDVIELPQGQTSATKIIAYPQFTHSYNMHVEVREDGVELRDLESDLGFPQRRGYLAWTEAVPSLLFLDCDAPSPDERQALIDKSNKLGNPVTPGEPVTLPDVRQFSFVFPDNYNNPQTNSGPLGVATNDLILRSINDSNKQELLAPSEMPTRWIEWTCFDVIFISLSDLRQMAAGKNQPQFAALLDWLRAGGTLCVHGTGTNYAQVPELEKLLALEPQPTDLQTADKRRMESAWKPPKNSDVHASGLNAQMEMYGNYNYAPIPPPKVAAKTGSKAGTKANSKREDGDALALSDPPYLIRPVMFGKLVVFAQDDPFPGKTQEWYGFFNTLGADQWMWYRRHGMSLTRDNHSYWEFLIPGVGKAPVLSFLFIITLFMLVIGPLNYTWLQRRARLQLLLVTVPAGAGLMVLGLFIFALATDGLSVRSRVRSFTQLDQKNRHAVSWSRQTYYAGLAPSRGLLYPETAAVYPLEAEPVSRGGRRQAGRIVEWDDAQRLRSGYISPRTAAQFLVIDAEPSEAKLEVTVKGDVTVANHLGSAISLLVLRDEAGELHVGTDVPDGQSQSLMPLPNKEAFEKWSRKVRVDHPELPADWNVSNDNLFSWMGMARNYYSQIDPQAPAASQETSLLERGLNDGEPGGFLDRLPKRSYLACTAAPVSTPLGLTRTRAKASVHVTFGKW